MFATNERTNLTLRMKLLPFIREGIWPQQRIGFELNGKPITSITMNQNHDTEVAISLPGDVLRPQNVLKLRLPDAASPELLKVSMDQRELGIAVYWIELQKNSDQPLAGGSR